MRLIAYLLMAENLSMFHEGLLLIWDIQLRFPRILRCFLSLGRSFKVPNICSSEPLAHLMGVSCATILWWILSREVNAFTVSSQEILFRCMTKEVYAMLWRCDVLLWQLTNLSLLNKRNSWEWSCIWISNILKKPKSQKQWIWIISVYTGPEFLLCTVDLGPCYVQWTCIPAVYSGPESLLCRVDLDPCCVQRNLVPCCLQWT